MGRKPFYTPDEKLNIVLSVLRRETTQTDVARRLEMSQTTSGYGHPRLGKRRSVDGWRPKERAVQMLSMTWSWPGSRST